MQIADAISRFVHVRLDAVHYSLLFSLAELQWSLLRAVFMMGYTVELLNRWLVEQAFTPLIAQVNSSVQVAVSAAFVIALLVLGMTYLLAAFARLRVVEAKSAIAWYLAGALFFTLGPQLFTGFTDLRRTLSQGFYGSSLSSLQLATGSAFSTLGQVTSSDPVLLPLCDNLGDYLPGGMGAVDGLDIALAYVRADGIDVMGYHPETRDLRCAAHPPDILTGLYAAGSLPYAWRLPGGYFANDREPEFFDFLTVEQRATAIRLGSSAQGRLITAWPLVLFGVAEQLTYLLLTVAQGISFLSFGIAILFAFFKKTEPIARSIVDLWIELLVQTVVIALVQSLIVTFFLVGAAAGNSIVALGVGLICLVFMIIVLLSGVRAVWNSLNRLFDAMGKVTGGTMVSPGAAAGLVTAGVTTAATGGVSLLGGAVAANSNALAGITALKHGATMAQAAGLTFGGVDALSGAARTLTRLPGLPSALSDVAEQFTEGAVTRQVARDIPLIGGVAGPLVGEMLLTNRDPDSLQKDERGRVVGRSMLLPRMEKKIRNWTSVDHEDENVEDSVFPTGFTAVGKGKRRMGVFTPLVSESTLNDADDPFRSEQRTDEERRRYADDMRGEELEQHITERVQSAESSDFGQVRANGVENVASILADALRMITDERLRAGVSPNTPLNYMDVGTHIARAMGIASNREEHDPVQANLARFGLFMDAALRTGLLPSQAGQVVEEVKSSPARMLLPDTREAFVASLSTQGRSREEAEREVARLESAARRLPNEIIAFGQINVTPQVEVNVNVASDEDAVNAAMHGSETMVGMNKGMQ